MATLLLTGLGTLIGGPLGGAIGALAGQQIDQAIIGTRTRQGPRLRELAVQASSYGAAIPRIYGRMRVAGSVIWATDLVEHREKKGGGKGRPKTVTYSYSSSFAVALSSRPILGVERIWADGNLLRGADGALKASGTMRLHTGHGEQATDPLLAGAEGVSLCPAFRGLAYVVFEDLQLADFGNRIPTLSFEVVADEGPVFLSAMIADLLPEASVAPIETAVTGFSVDAGSVGDVLDAIGEVVPLSCTSRGLQLHVAPAEASAEAAALLPEAVPSGGDEPGGHSGFHRRREPLPRQRLAALRYYDVDRDYQPGLQQGRGRALPGGAATIEFPAALNAAAARALAESASQREALPADRATYRVAELDPALAPGAIARVPGSPERWRIEDWEWTSRGVELGLRAVPGEPGGSLQVSDPGRANVAVDLPPAVTVLAALELPWDGVGAGNSPALFAAVSAASQAWKGAALFALQPDGSLIPLGGSGRARAVIGTAASVLQPGSPLALDRAHAVEIELAGPDLTLAEASLGQLAMGANRALLGSELIQFGRAEPLGAGRWRLSDLLRGRGGTESAIAAHCLGERFVLLDDALVPLDGELVGDAAHVQLAALGLADPTPVTAGFALPGATLRPLSPVHGTITIAGDGAVRLGWTRRARGAWLWPDGVDAPLAEQTESYVVTFGEIPAPVMTWETTQPFLSVAAETAAQLRAAAPGGCFAVRQRGSRALSEPLVLGALA